MPRIRTAVVVSLAVIATACSGSEAPRSLEPAQPTTVSRSGAAQANVAPADDQGPAAPRRVRGFSDWEVGAKPLPLRSDGFGRVLPTPPELRVRRFATVDRLRPPPDGRFESSIHRIGPWVRARMGRTWRPACPVGLGDLRYVRVSFWGFDHRPHTGEIIVHRRVARDVVGVFDTLFQARFPIESMRIAKPDDVDAPPTGDGNGSGGYMCRPMRKGSTWSAHAYGLAVDINPFQNPYRRGDLVLPELARAYLDRSWMRPGMIRPGGVVTRAFADIGWGWGGSWQSPHDYMHFSATNY